MPVRNNIVLIDFESVQPETVAQLTEEHFRVLLFVGANQSKVGVELASAIQQLGPRGEYIRMSGNGPNALDFHIAYYVGRISAEDDGAYFHIISRDKGFDPLIAHLKSRKIFAGRWESIDDIPIVKHANSKSYEEKAEIYIAKLSEPKVTRPRTDKTLARALKAFFREALQDDEVPGVIQAIRATGFLSISGGKITYASADR